MSKTLDVPLSDIKFPSSCVVCLSPLRKSLPLKRLIPMDADHISKGAGSHVRATF
jgi:hypothetical protein